MGSSPVELLVPLSHRGTGIPTSLAGKVAGAFTGEKAAREIGYVFGGRSAKPKQPILLWGPDGRTLMVLVGDGTAEAAELEELALAQLEKAAATQKRTGRAVDFDALREKNGLMRREDVDTAVRQAFRDAPPRRK